MRIAEISKENRVDVEGFQDQISKLEVRIGILEKKQALAADSMPGWVAPTVAAGGAFVSASVAVVGFFLVHHLSVRRQRRDEFFKRIQDCTVISNEASQAASEIWRSPGNKISASALQLLQAKLDALTNRLTLLNQAEPRFNVTSVDVEFRSAAMLDIEPLSRSADIERADRVLRLGQELTRQLLQNYSDVFDGKPKKAKRK